MNTIIEQRKQNWIDFFDIKSPVSRILLTYCDENMPPCPLLWWENIKEREEWAYGKYMVQMDRLDKIHDNTIPFLSMLTGTEIFAEAFGCPVHKPSEFMFSFLDEWFRRYGSDFIAHHPDYYMPYGITLSEDEIGIINSDMYRTYFHQELCDFSARYGAIGIHSCADSQHQ